MSFDPERWREIDRILDGALDTPPDARARFLDETCGTDAELRREVEALIASCEQASNMFEDAPAVVAKEIFGVSVPEWERMAPGTVIGHWRIVGQLGRGGMGAVFLAERADGAFEKSAALKIVKRGMDTDEIIERFRHERQILARLEHPNIGGLIDGGVTDDNLPYFVMELAQGPPIDHYCDSHRLTIADRLHMFRTVCEAVQYAHRNLVVHRDLKPGNIVVVDGQVKLLDFGIAKLLASDGASAVGAVTQAYAQRLTPQYAAPEQVRGEATTTATDVYSLGAILYELLCGHSPYRIESSSLREIERVVCQEIPRAPSAMVARDAEGSAEIAKDRAAGVELLLDQLRGDLDAICLKALRKEPGERYDSVAALAEDIQRHLTGVPVLARPQTRRYRVAKFVQRNKGLVSLSGLAAAALVIGTAVALWQAHVARLRSIEREEEALRATAAREYLVGILDEFDPDRLQGDREFNAERVIEVGFDKLESLRGQPLVHASAMNTLARIMFNFGQRERADSLFREAYGILNSRGQDLDLAVSMMGIGEAMRWRLQNDSAVAWFRRALDIRRGVLDAMDPIVAESEVALASAIFADPSSQNADPVQRDSALQEAYRLNADVAAMADIPTALRADAFEGIADVAFERFQYDSAIATYRRALSVRSQIGENDPDNGRILWGLALATWHKASQLQGSGAAATDSMRSLVTELYADAGAHFRRALDIHEQVYGDDNPNVVTSEYLLGWFLDRTRGCDEAQPHYARSVEIASRLDVRDHGWTGYAYTALGKCLLRDGDSLGSEQALRAGLEIFETTTSTPPSAIHDAQFNLGRALVLQARYEEALPFLRLAYAAWSRPESNSPSLQAEAATELTTAHRALGNADSADHYATRGPTAVTGRRPD